MKPSKWKPDVRDGQRRQVSAYGFGRAPNSGADIPVVILAGGLGTRLREETAFRPKPMVEVGGRPILWHIMKIYDHFGFRRFVLPVGYLGDMIKAYFLSYADRHADFTADTLSGKLIRHDNPPESWRVTVVDIGLDTMTGGRVRRLGGYLPGRFMMTYGDGVADVPIDRLFAFHESHGRLAEDEPVKLSATFASPTCSTWRTLTVVGRDLTTSWIVVAGDSSGSDSREQGQQAS